MQVSVLSLLALAAIGNGHSIFQQLQVNGVSQGLLTGVRSPDSNYPITDVTSSSLTCNTGIHMPVSTAVITIPAGAQVAAQWGHVIGGQQFANDPDNPIASSHHGPVIYWLAKVATGTAGTAATTGLQWFKVYQDTLTNGLWGVDNMIANGGWSKFTLPSCIAPGDYLLRVEIIALHNAYNQAGAQFYNSCSNIRVTGSGTFTGSGFVSLPGAYSATDPGILINIYDASGNPTNGGKPYTAPGGPVQACPAGGTKPTSTSSTVKPTTTTAPTTTTSKSTAQPTSTSSGGAALYGQCGGQGWTGPTTCASGKCTVSNAYYSQCLP